MEFLIYFVLVMVTLYFFGSLVKRVMVSMNGMSHEILSVGEANTKLWSKEQRFDIAQRAKEIKDAPSWDEIDALL